jgi:hypothetical protein
MHASIMLGNNITVTAYGYGPSSGTRWVDLTEASGAAITLWIPKDDGDAVAGCSALIAALENLRRAALDGLAASVKAEHPEDEVDLPDTTGYGRLGAAWSQQSKAALDAALPEDVICEDPELGTWAPGEVVEAYGS